MTRTPGMEVAADTHVGGVRRRNDDSFAALPRLGLFVVADGMGGKPGGDVASRAAVDTVRAAFEQEDPDETWPYGLERGTAREEAQMLQAFRRANAAVHEQAVRTPRLRGMGTTLTAALVRGMRLFVGHVGDSRVYRLREGYLEQLTQDHSLIEVARRQGVALGEAEERAAGMLVRAVGTDVRVEVETRAEVVEPGDTLLLCSDGLWGPVREDEIATTLAWRCRPAVIVSGLIARALERGGPDNVTCVVVRIGEERRP